MAHLEIQPTGHKCIETGLQVDIRRKGQVENRSELNTSDLFPKDQVVELLNGHGSGGFSLREVSQRASVEPGSAAKDRSEPTQR